MLGKIYFAWVSSSEEFNAATHAREDESVFALRISETEGEYATATVEVKNPRRGLLSPARKQRAYISAEIAGTVRLLFAGRVLGIPAALSGETVELEFVGRPDDHEDRLADLMSDLKSDSRYHPALVAEEQRDDITAILEGFAALPHWSRTTGALTLAPVSREGAGQPFINLGGSILEDSLDVSFATAPADAVTVELDLSWVQTVPVASRLLSADPGYGASGPIADAFGGERPRSLTGEDFVSRWPTPGSSLDGGWTVAGGYLERRGDGAYSRSVPVVVAPPSDPTYTGNTYDISFPEYEFDGTLVVSGIYEQPRREIVSFTLRADLQPVSVFPAPEIVTLSAVGEDVAPIDPASLVLSYRAPDEDGDGLSTRYVTTTYKRRALMQPGFAANSAAFPPVLRAALARAEARLRKAARCVTASFDIPFDSAIDITAAHVLRIADDRIPGGQIFGKVISVELIADGDGQCMASVTIGASVGRASMASKPSLSVVPYDPPSEPAVVAHCRSVGVDVAGLSVSSLRIRHPSSSQKSVLDGLDISAEISRFAAMGYPWAQGVDSSSALAAMEEALAEIPTEVDAQLVSLEPSDETVTAVSIASTGMLGVTQDIDLEA